MAENKQAISAIVWEVQSALSIWRGLFFPFTHTKLQLSRLFPSVLKSDKSLVSCACSWQSTKLRVLCCQPYHGYYRIGEMSHLQLGLSAPILNWNSLFTCLLSDQKWSSFLIHRLTCNCTHLASFPPILGAKVSLHLSHLRPCSWPIFSLPLCCHLPYGIEIGSLLPCHKTKSGHTPLFSFIYTKSSCQRQFFESTCSSIAYIASVHQTELGAATMPSTALGDVCKNLLVHSLIQNPYFISA